MAEKYRNCLTAGFRKRIFQGNPGKDAADGDGGAFKLPAIRLDRAFSDRYNDLQIPFRKKRKDDEKD